MLPVVLVHGVFVLVQGVFVLVHGVFVLVHGVFVLVQGVFVLVQGVFVLVHRVLGLRSSFLGVRFRKTHATMPMFADAHISSLGYLWSFAGTFEYRINSITRFNSRALLLDQLVYFSCSSRLTRKVPAESSV